MTYKIQNMTAQDYRVSINQLLDKVGDDTVLEACYEILKNAVKINGTRIIGYETDGTPITKLQFENEVVAAQKRVASDEFISHDSLVKQMKNY